MERLEHHIRSCSLNYTKPCYVLKLDIRSYFMSIDRDILHAKAQRLLRWIGRQDDPRSGCRNDATGRFRTVAYLTGLIVRHDPLEECRYRGERRLLGRLPHGKSLAHAPEGCGLPIGNLTSQLFSNLYLNDFDHFMKDRLRLKHYGRYVDDFYVVHNDPEYLLSLIPRIGRFLRDDAALTLHPAKTKLADARHGIAFLGSYVKPYRRYVLRAPCAASGKKLDRLQNRPPEYLAEPRRLHGALASVNSFLGTFLRARSYRLRQRMFARCILFRYGYAAPLMRKFVLDERWKNLRVEDPDRRLEPPQETPGGPKKKEPPAPAATPATTPPRPAKGTHGARGDAPANAASGNARRRTRTERTFDQYRYPDNVKTIRRINR